LGSIPVAAAPRDGKVAADEDEDQPDQRDLGLDVDQEVEPVS
jgi:hypothetical protein